ncbi:MAG: hypothetical protein M3N52_13895 [Actinomycetota bacterium]|nr:hypothetical protein [Actinomycetota bacterium]
MERGRRAHCTAQARIRLAAGAGWDDNDLVFPRHDGTWWNVSSVFRRAVKAAADLLEEAGADILAYTGFRATCRPGPPTGASG